MTTYNHELYIEEAIRSVLHQDYDQLQVIISDDCSTDKTFAILERYQQLYPEIVVLQRHPSNIGIAKNIASIYPLIKGQFICWFSGDDVYLPCKISKQVNVMLNNPDCIFNFHAVDVINHQGRILYDFNDPSFGIQMAASENINKKLLEDRCFICAHAIMINRELAKGIKHQEEADICSDWLLLFELATCGRVIYIPETLALYRRHALNLSKRVNISAERGVYDYVLEHYPNYNLSVNIGLAQLYAVYIFKYVLNLNFFMSLNCINQLIRIWVQRPKSLFVSVKKIASEANKRLRLLFVTGSIIR